MMVGRSLNQRFPDKENKPGEVILEVRNLDVTAPAVDSRCLV